MKKNRNTGIVLTVLLLVACSPKSTDEQIVGKWKFHHLDFASSGKGEMSSEEKMSVDMAAGMMSGLTIEYFSDMTLEMSMAGSTTGNLSGKYELINDGKYIQSQYNDGKGNSETERQEILLVSNDSLKLQLAEGPIMIYSRVK